MKLSKEIPKHTKTEYFIWCKKEFMLVKIFNEARSKMGMSLVIQCYWCKYKFTPDDMIALACPEKGKNRMLCQKCADELLNSTTQIVDKKGE